MAPVEPPAMKVGQDFPEAWAQCVGTVGRANKSLKASRYWYEQLRGKYSRAR